MDSATSRNPVDPATVLAQLPEGFAGRWRVQAVSDTASTNADLLEAARVDQSGTPELTALVAQFQHGGRGRLDRSWSSPPGAGLTVSLLVRPTVPLSRWGWLPLLAGVALVQAVGGDARLKWPNDLLLGPEQHKAAGILVQADTDQNAGNSAGAVAVVGIGLNVSSTAAELPIPTATSLAIQGHSGLDRDTLLAALLTAFTDLYDAWQRADGDAEASGLAANYRNDCATIGANVEVEFPGGTVSGRATTVDDAGRLLIRTEDAADPIAVAAGDVTHLRSDSR